MAERRSESRVSPRRVLAALAAIIIVGIVFAPPSPVESGGLLTTFASDPTGARGFHEAVRRLGWTTTRVLEPLDAPLDTAAIYVILRPPIDLTSREASAVLDAVRRGAGLLLVPGFHSTIMDSLGLRRSTPAMGPLLPVNDAVWDSLGAAATPRWPTMTVELTDSAPDSVAVLLAARRFGAPRDSSSAVVLGVPVGRGRVAVLAHGAVLANALFRDDANAELPIRLLEWLAPGRRPNVVFPEYHQGHGRHASVAAAIRRAMVSTPPGRVLLHLLAAGAILLLAIGIRPIAPRSLARIERRSPLEHIGALAQAYEQIGATRTAVRRLTRGLRRRHPIGSLRTASDEEYLISLAARHPAAAADVDVVKASLAVRQPSDRFREAGAAIAHIERVLRT